MNIYILISLPLLCVYIYGNVPVTHSLFYTPSLRCIFGNIVIVVTTIVRFNRFLTVFGVQPRLCEYSIYFLIRNLPLRQFIYQNWAFF